jgi:ATP-binding cassette subfamily F protein uup
VAKPAKKGKSETNITRISATDKGAAKKPAKVTKATKVVRVKPAIDTNNQQPKKKLSFKEQRELETIEKEMPELEKKRAEILEKLNNEADYEKIATLSADLETISGKLEEYEMRWLELQEIMS